MLVKYPRPPKPAGYEQIEVDSEFASGILVLDGNITAGVHAESDLTVVGAAQPDPDGEVVIGDEAYIFVAELEDGGGPNQVEIGDTAADTLANLAAAINGDAGEGVLYGEGTVAHAEVVATATSTVLTIKKKAPEATTLATTTDITGWAWDGATIADGTAGVDGDEAGIGDITYTFVDELSEDHAEAIPNQVLHASTDAIALDNLKLAINGGDTEGTEYSTGTEAHPLVEATDNTDTSQAVQAKELGTEGNDIAVSTTGADLEWQDADTDPIDALVGGAGLGVLDIPQGARYAVIKVAEKDVMWRDDGTPTPTFGMPAKEGEEIELVSREQLRGFKVIETGDPATLEVRYYEL